MAEFRYIHTRIWKDNWFCDLEQDAKLLFIYLFSNERASVSGIYEIPLKYLVFESGLERDRVIELLKQFRADKKVYYDFETGVVWVVNLRKYNETTSEKVQTRLSKDIASIPDSDVLRIYCQHHQIPYPYGINTPPNRDRDRDGEETETEGEEKPPALPELTPAEIEKQVLEYWHCVFPEKPQPRPGTFRDKIAARFKSQHFRENWQTALSKASLSQTCQTESWFNFEFFVKNEKNYQNMLDNWMAWKDKEVYHKNGKPAAPPAPPVDTMAELELTRQRTREMMRKAEQEAADATD